MGDDLYLGVSLALAVGITLALRALPFALRSTLRESALVADLGRRMPLGAVVILTVYCLTAIDLSWSGPGLGPVFGVAVTFGIHAWRRNALLSIAMGTTTCLVVVNAF